MSADLQAHAMNDAMLLGGMAPADQDWSGAAVPHPERAILLTNDYRKTGYARAVPYAYFAGGSWWLPPDPDPDSARYALRLFPSLNVTNPELVARAKLSVVDHTPIDYSMPRWLERYGPDGRRPAEDPWQRTAAAAAAAGITPHPFQRADADYAIECLDKARGAYFGWEMGLGKTLGACMVIDGWPANFVFIACPNSAKHDPWELQLAKFCPWLEVVTVGNTAKARDAALERAKALLDAGTPMALICHYQAIPLIDGKNKRGWKKLGQWDLLICDEAHLLQNQKSQFVRAVKRLDTAGRLNLSGSVMSGAPERLFVPWSMFRPKRYRRQWEDWNDRFLDTVETDYGKVIIGPSPSRLPQFRAELGESLVVRPARKYLKLPEPRVIEHELGLHPEQKRVYHELTEDLMSELPDGQIQLAGEGASLLTAHRRVTGGVPDGKGGYISTKLDRGLEVIEGAGDSQILVFAWHKALVRAFVGRCHKAGIGCGVIDGDVPIGAARDRVIDLFKAGGYRVLCATIATLSSAVNLQNASVVIMAEESNDPIDNEQSIGRALRQGQLQSVSVHYLRVKDSVDDLQVLPNYVTKQELRKMVLGAHIC